MSRRCRSAWATDGVPRRRRRRRPGAGRQEVPRRQGLVRTGRYARPRSGTGQVFGGTVKIEEPNGRVWVFRHVVPKVRVGDAVVRGEPVATVTA